MNRRRTQSEIKNIVTMAIVAVIIYIMVFSLSVLAKNSEEEAEQLLAEVQLSSSPQHIEVDNQYGSYSLTLGTNSWICDQNEDLNIIHTRVTMMSMTLRSLEPSRMLEASDEYLESFGLLDPQATIAMTVDGEEKVYSIGNYNPTLDAYYMIASGSDYIYLISSSNVATINRDLMELIDEPTFTGTDAQDIETIDLTSSIASYSISRVDTSTFTVVTVTETFSSTQYKVQRLYSVLNSATYVCASYNATEEDLAQYGLVDPEVVMEITFADGASYTISVGTGLDGNHYLSEGDDGYVYQIGDSYYESFIERIPISNLKSDD